MLILRAGVWSSSLDSRQDSHIPRLRAWLCCKLPGRQQVIAQGIGPGPPLWEIWMEIWLLALTLAQLWPLQAFGEQTRGWQLSVSISISLLRLLTSQINSLYNDHGDRKIVKKIYNYRIIVTQNAKLCRNLLCFLPPGFFSSSSFLLLYFSLDT